MTAPDLTPTDYHRLARAIENFTRLAIRAGAMRETHDLHCSCDRENEDYCLLPLGEQMNETGFQLCLEKQALIDAIAEWCGIQRPQVDDAMPFP